ncbi:MAG: hypothetical protein ACREXW_12935 [Gammaproteobacteria bacterium]
MRKPFRSIALAALVITAVSAMSNAEAWSFGTQMRSPGGDYRGYGVRPQPSGSGGGFSFGYGTGGFNSCSLPHGGFYAECRYSGSSFAPSTNYVPPPTYRYSPYAPGFYNGYEDGYYRGYHDSQRNRQGRRHKRFRSR